MMTRRSFLVGSLASSALLAVGAAGYATEVEPFWIKVRNVPVRLANLPASWRGLRVCQVSDLHVCPRIPNSYLRRGLAQVRELKPDLIVYTGDFTTLGFDCWAQLDELKGAFPVGRLGACAVLGNHDYGFGWADQGVASKTIAFLGREGIRVLRNESVDVQGLRVVGLDEFWAGRCDPKRALQHVDPEGPTLMLCHNPDGADLPSWGNQRGWILAGHTHGGQCRPPFLPPPLLPVMNRRYSAGEIRLSDRRTMYINRGLGYLRQVRFNVRPEITILTLS